ncbi:PREDICTED: immunoglobulin iota chain-like [Elephantulus edwardii]|uniref:immunoglobulin iota chain-like n=1 Tax=Elephantulus edwardii TaxID=28737 RepID=UPI0003F0CB85|nr:PREDICTED: immunoglobulin iota chain-like [Elephantulus edwardii]
MSWAPILLMLLICGAGCGSQPVLHQPPRVSASLGTSVSLACTLSGDYNVGLYKIYWYQQRPGQSPRFLLSFFSSTKKKQGPKVPLRFSSFKDVARNTGYLRITSLQEEDEAVYYCAVGSQSMEREKGEDKEFEASGSEAP